MTDLQDEIDAMFNSHGIEHHFTNLVEDVTLAPLDPPQWEINIDTEGLQGDMRDISREGEEWERDLERILEDWSTDRELIDRYYMNYELQPHLKEGEKIDEKTLKTVVTYIVDGTQIVGRPMIEVFPEVEDYMLSNFDPEGPSLSDKFGLYNLQEEHEFIPSDETLVFEFKFDSERINHFLNMKLTKVEMINNMYEAEF